MWLGQYLDYENCRIWRTVFEECGENTDGNELIYNGTVNDYEEVCNSCMVYLLLFVIFLIISIGISSCFIYFHWYLKN